jgi:sugar O-acyltransferase (sialic acid O-acetyltransferase NeuD family)
MNKLIIVGCGGFGREVANVALSLELWSDIYFVDDAKPANTLINGIKVLGGSNTLTQYTGDVFVALGNIQARKAVIEDLKINKEISFPNVIHPSCGWVYNNLNKLGQGNYIGECVVGTVNISIGNFNLINIGCLISHDTGIGSFCNLMHGVKITSGAELHDFINVGSGASILSAGHIESTSEINANAVYE